MPICSLPLPMITEEAIPLTILHEANKKAKEWLEQEFHNRKKDKMKAIIIGEATPIEALQEAMDDMFLVHLSVVEEMQQAFNQEFEKFAEAKIADCQRAVKEAVAEAKASLIKELSKVSY